MYSEIREIPEKQESKLTYYRKRKNLTERELSNLSGVGFKTILSCEMGYRDINKIQAITLYKISQVLECNIEDLLELKNDKE